MFVCWVVGLEPLDGQLTPATAGGIVELDHLLQRLSEPRKLLVIGAHPDDEDTGLLALAARGYGADAAYLSLSRGEGGQNLIGEELGVELGLLRSQELVAARTIDGAHQFFTRAYDFGYSRSLAETSRFWVPDSVLKDAVRIVRRFRPDVIVSVFSGTSRDRHGQHQLAGVTAREAFRAAGDPTRFPELEREEGLRPWTPLKLYRSTRFDSTSTTVRMSTGQLDPRLGKSIHQIAMDSRSRHSSQDMGQLQTIGPAWTRLQLVSDRTESVDAPGESDIFRGIERRSSALSRLADSLRQVVTPTRLAEATRPLARALAARQFENGDEGQLLQRAIAASAGLVVDGSTADPRLVPGSEAVVHGELYNAGPHRVEVEAWIVDTPGAWTVTASAEAAGPLAPGSRRTMRFVVQVPSAAGISQPYFLEQPMVGGMYDWSRAPSSLRGLPFNPPVLTIRARLRVEGAMIDLTREVSYRYNDQAHGEIRTPVEVVPALDVKLEPARILWPANDTVARDVRVTLAFNGRDSVRGTVGLVADGWPLPAPERFTFGGRGESRTFTFRVSRPPHVDRARVSLGAVARLGDGREFDRGISTVTYSHVRPTSRVANAEATIRVAPILLPKVTSIGYVRGAADRVPEALAQVGLPVVPLDARALAAEALSQFDAIVIGSRAFETHPALVEHNARLLEYVRGGGLLLVQYQQYQFARGGYAPYPLTIGRPHDRITDETSPVTMLDVNHPAFQSPNRIDADDWEGWPQERGLYFAQTWDPAYVPLLEMRDPDRDPVRGGLLVARYGDGTYIYTGVSFFRALPAAVPGALRLFLNLLNLEAPPSS